VRFETVKTVVLLDKRKVQVESQFQSPSGAMGMDFGGGSTTKT